MGCTGIGQVLSARPGRRPCERRPLGRRAGRSSSWPRLLPSHGVVPRSTKAGARTPATRYTVQRAQVRSTKGRGVNPARSDDSGTGSGKGSGHPWSLCRESPHREGAGPTGNLHLHPCQPSVRPDSLRPIPGVSLAACATRWCSRSARGCAAGAAAATPKTRAAHQQNSAPGQHRPSLLRRAPEGRLPGLDDRRIRDFARSPCSPGFRLGADPPGAVAPGPREWTRKRGIGRIPRAVNIPPPPEQAGGRSARSGKADLRHFVAPASQVTAPCLPASSGSNSSRSRTASGSGMESDNPTVG